MGDMMGDFNDSPEGQIARDNQVEAPPDGKVNTDVENCFADAEFRGNLVFDVSKKEYYDNMRVDRKRLRLKTGSPAQTYYSKTNYKVPFYIRNQEDGFLRKIK